MQSASSRRCEKLKIYFCLHKMTTQMNYGHIAGSYVRFTRRGDNALFFYRKNKADAEIKMAGEV